MSRLDCRTAVIETPFVNLATAFDVSFGGILGRRDVFPAFVGHLALPVNAGMECFERTRNVASGDMTRARFIANRASASKSPPARRGQARSARRWTKGRTTATQAPWRRIRPAS